MATCFNHVVFAANSQDTYAILFQKMRDAFMREAILTKGSPLLLAAAVPVGKLSIDAGYDVPKLSR